MRGVKKGSNFLSVLKYVADTESRNEVRSEELTVTAENVAKHMPPTIRRK
jgi:hypothetical protein